MRKSLLFLLVLSAFHYCSLGQGVNNIYLSGYAYPVRNTIDFISGVPVISADSINKSNLSYTHANISDKNGNLLFYTNGIVVLDGNHDTMPNGKGLNPCQATSNNAFYGLPSYQADIIIPFVNDSNKYYLFHQSLEYLSIYASSQIYYSIVDMTLNNGKGDVLNKNVSFYQDTLAGGMNTACKHANGRDWWLIVPKAFGPTYYIFLISPQGIQLSSTQTIGQRIDVGQAAFSPDGSMYGFYDYRDGMDVLDFDRCTGTFSNWRHEVVNDTIWGLGFCFSPDSKLAYAACALYLYQFNLDSANLGASMQTVATWDGTYDPAPPLEATFEFMQIAPDNKIYMTTVWATRRMHYIDYPDSLGTACGMHQHSIVLPTYNNNTIPNFPNYFLGPVIGSICDSLGLGITESMYDKNLNLRINPNPAQGSFYVNYELPTGKDATLTIYNPMGQKIFSQRVYSVNKSLQVHCDEWKPGVYFVKVVMDRDGFAANAKVVVY